MGGRFNFVALFGMKPALISTLLAGLMIAAVSFGDAVSPPNSTPRPAQGEAELRFWMENMVVHHGYTVAEAAAATGLSTTEIEQAVQRFQFPARPAASDFSKPLKLLPYPGGRHPRLGFFDGAIDPQRDTKVSIFAPWDARSYVVVDVPEAIWSHLGLTYLAHTHIDTIWTKQGIKLEPLEWSRRADGSLSSERRLPNGIVFGVEATPRVGHVAFRWWLRNGTPAPLTGLRAQVCAMLGYTTGFSAQTETNKLLDPPFVAARDTTGRRWVITAWDSLDRAWQNPPVPCLHSDPALADCPPGETRTARGWLWFYEGDAVQAELARLRREFLTKPATTLKPVASTASGLLLEPPVDLSKFTREEFLRVSASVGAPKINKQWTTAIIPLPPHPRPDVHGLNEPEVKAYMLKVRDLFETGAAVVVSDVGLISTQEDVIRRPMFNHIAAFSNAVAHVYLLVQKPLEAETWGTFSIVQDRTTEPPTDYFAEIKNDEVKLEAVSCFKCHSNGPLAIHPAREDLINDPALMAAFNQHIEELPLSRTHYPAHDPAPAKGYGEPQALKACSRCHAADEDRAPLFKAHSHSIRVLVDYGYMPPNRRLKPDELAELKTWLDAKP